MKAMKNVLILYHNWGMHIQEFFADPEFTPSENAFATQVIKINVGSANKHMEGIKRKMRVLKEKILFTIE